MKISWEKFFSGGSLYNYHCYYKAFINEIRVEKHTFKSGVEYSIGNMDNAKIKYKSEKDLLEALAKK